MYNALASLYSDLPGYELDKLLNTSSGIPIVNPQTQLNRDLAQIQSQAPQVTPQVNPETRAKLQIEMQLAQARNNPLYKQFQADPLTTDMNLRNANAVVAGLQQRLRPVSKETENPYEKFLTEQFHDMRSRNYATGWSGSTNEENEARRKQLYDVAKELGDIYKTKETAKATTAATEKGYTQAKELKEMEYKSNYDKALIEQSTKILEAQIKGGGGKPLGVSELNTLSNFRTSSNLLSRLISRYSEKGKEHLFGLPGMGERSMNALLGGTISAEANLYNQDIDLLRKQIAKSIEGGRMSDFDWRTYKQMLFAPNVSQESFIEALTAYNDYLRDKVQDTLMDYETAGRDVSGFKNLTEQTMQGAEITAPAMTGQGQIIDVNSEQEANNLPVGTRFRFNGRVGTVK